MNIHIRSAFHHIRRSPFQALAAITVLGLTFFVGTVLAILVYSSNNILTYFETRPQVIAFLTDVATPSQISELHQKLESDERAKEVRFVSKEEALSIYKEATSDNPLLTELVDPSIFPASIEFSVTDLSFAGVLISEVKENVIVDQIGFTANVGRESDLGDVVSRLRRITLYVRIGGAVLLAVMTVASFLILTVIIGMRMATRRGEIEILDLIGARPGFIRSPIVLEALIYSFVGVFIGWTTVLIIFLYSTPSLASYFGNIPVLPKDTVELLIIFGILLAAELIAGFGLGLTGSLLAVSRARKKKR